MEDFIDKPIVHIDFRRFSSDVGICVWFDFGIDGFDEIVSIIKSCGGTWDKEYKCWQVKGTFCFYCADLINSLKFVDVRMNTFFVYHKKMELKRLEKNVALSRLKKPTKNLDIPCPSGISYFDFQKAVVEFFTLRGKSILLADDMGLGKTISAIAIANYHKYKKILVVCPDNAKDKVWKKEFSKWYVYPNTLAVINAGKEYLGGADIVVINYDLLIKYEKLLASERFTYLIADEAHKLKGKSTKRTLSFKNIANTIHNKIFLTGTPVLNRPSELYSLLRLLSSGLFGNSLSYAFRYCNAKLIDLDKKEAVPDGEDKKVRRYLDDRGYSNLSELNFKLRSTIMMRREKIDVIKEFPLINRYVISINAEYSKTIDEKYKAEKKRYASELNDVKKKRGEYFDYSSYTKAILKLQRYHFEEISSIRHELGFNKVGDIIRFVDGVFNNIDIKKLVLFLHHRDVIDKIYDNYSKESVVVYGGMTSHQKTKAVSAFEDDPKIKLFIGSIQASGVAYTLTMSHTVVFGELDWTPSLIHQSEGRCYRLGQKHAVDVYYLIVNSSLDQNMMKKIDSKSNVIKKIMV